MKSGDSVFLCALCGEGFSDSARWVPHFSRAACARSEELISTLFPLLGSLGPNPSRTSVLKDFGFPVDGCPISRALLAREVGNSTFDRFSEAWHFSRGAMDLPRALFDCAPCSSVPSVVEILIFPAAATHVLVYSVTFPSTTTATYFPDARSRNCTTRCPARANCPHRLGFSEFCSIA